MKKKIFITGGSSGLGLALARLYASQGNDLVILARDSEKLGAAVAICEGMSVNSRQIISGVSLDVAASENIPSAMAKIIESHGLPDLLILCAGVAGNKRFLDTGPTEFDRIVDVNLAGSREVARAVLPGMLRRRSGQLVFVSSMAGLIGLYGYSAYAASKFAVTGFAQALRQELAGSGVSVHLVCPPEMNTPMIAAEREHSLPQTRFLKDLVGTLEVEPAARKIARGIRRHKAVIIPGLRARTIAWTARHFPEIFAKSCRWLLRWKFP